MIDPITGLDVNLSKENPNLKEPTDNKSSAQNMADLSARFYGEGLDIVEGISDSKYNTNISASAVRQGKLEAMRAQNQPFHHEMANFAVQLGGEILGGTLEGIGLLGELVQGNTIAVDQENFLINIGRAISEGSRETNPIYLQDPNGFILGSSENFFSNMVSIGSTLSLLIPSVGTMRALSLLGKLGKGTRAMNILSKLAPKLPRGYTQGIGSALISRQIENNLEAYEEYKGLKSELKGSINPETGNPYSEDEINTMALEAAKDTYLANWVMLAQDIPQYLAIGKIYNPIFNRMDKTFVKKLGKYGAAKKIASQMAQEGLEEAYQFAAAEEASYNVKFMNGLVDYSTFSERMKEYMDENEFWNATIAGAAGGGVFQFAGEKFSDLINRTANRKHQESMAEISKERGIRYAKALTDIQKADAEENLVASREARRSWNATMTIESLHNDTYDQHIEFLEAMASTDPQDLEEFKQKYGLEEFSNEMIQEMGPELINQAKGLREDYFKAIKKFGKWAAPHIALDQRTKNDMIAIRDKAANELNEIRANHPNYNNLSPTGRILFDLNLEKESITTQKLFQTMVDSINGEESNFDKLDERLTNINDQIALALEDDFREDDIKESDKEILDTVSNYPELADKLATKTFAEDRIKQLEKNISAYQTKEFEHQVKMAYAKKDIERATSSKNLDKIEEKWKKEGLDISQMVADRKDGFDNAEVLDEKKKREKEDEDEEFAKQGYYDNADVETIDVDDLQGDEVDTETFDSDQVETEVYEGLPDDLENESFNLNDLKQDISGLTPLETYEYTKKAVDKKLKDKKAQLEKEKKQALEKARIPKMSNMVGKVAYYNGVKYQVGKEGVRYILENENSIVELPGVTDTTGLDETGLNVTFEQPGKYKIESLSEELVTVNGVDYTINLDNKGNIESLSPTNKPSQNIKNEKMLVAVEIERNKMDIQALDKEEVLDAAIEKNPTLLKIQGVYSKNWNNTVDRGIDNLYEGKKLTDTQALAIQLWLEDANLGIMELYDKDQRQEYINAFDNLQIIANLLELRGKGFNVKPKDEKPEKVSGTKPTKKATKLDSKKVQKLKEESKLPRQESEEERITKEYDKKIEEIDKAIERYSKEEFKAPVVEKVIPTAPVQIEVEEQQIQPELDFESTGVKVMNKNYLPDTDANIAFHNKSAWMEFIKLRQDKKGTPVTVSISDDFFNKSIDQDGLLEKLLAGNISDIEYDELIRLVEMKVEVLDENGNVMMLNDKPVYNYLFTIHQDKRFDFASTITLRKAVVDAYRVQKPFNTVITGMYGLKFNNVVEENNPFDVFDELTLNDFLVVDETGDFLNFKGELDPDFATEKQVKVLDDGTTKSLSGYIAIKVKDNRGKPLKRYLGTKTISEEQAEIIRAIFVDLLDNKKREDVTSPIIQKMLKDIVPNYMDILGTDLPTNQQVLNLFIYWGDVTIGNNNSLFLARGRLFFSNNGWSANKEQLMNSTQFMRWITTQIGHQVKPKEFLKNEHYRNYILDNRILHTKLDKNEPFVVGKGDNETGIVFIAPPKGEVLKPKLSKTDGITVSYQRGKGKRYEYVVKGNKIFNLKGEEVFSKPDRDRNRIFANAAVKSGRAKIIKHKGKNWVINQEGQIMSEAGNIMEWPENHGDRIAISQKAGMASTAPKVQSTEKIYPFEVYEVGKGVRPPTEEDALEPGKRIANIIAKLKGRSKNIKGFVEATGDTVELGENFDKYIDTQSGKLYDRVTSKISDEEWEENQRTESARTIGNNVDRYVRDFFDNTLEDEEAYKLGPQVKEFKATLQKVKDNMDARGEKVLAKDIILVDDQNNIAGTVDLLTYDKKGEFRIYDMKTMNGDYYKQKVSPFSEEGRRLPSQVKYTFKGYYDSNEKRYVANDEYDSYLDKHTKQLSMYRIILNNTYGVKAKTIAIMPIEVSYKPGDDSTTKVRLITAPSEYRTLTPLDTVAGASITNSKSQIFPELGQEIGLPSKEVENIINQELDIKEGVQETKEGTNPSEFKLYSSPTTSNDSVEDKRARILAMRKGKMKKPMNVDIEKGQEKAKKNDPCNSTFGIVIRKNS